MDATNTTPSTGSESSTSTGAESSATSSGASSTGSTAGSTPADKTTSEPAEPKWYGEKTKIKRGGQERELTAKEALAMLGDDYEHEVEVGKERRKAKYADLVRGYQKADGAERLMRDAADLRKKLNDQIEFSRKDPAWALENVLGVEDHRAWAAQIIHQQIADETRLNQLAQQDPGAYHREMENRARQAFERKQAFERAQAQRAEQAKQAEERKKQNFAQATEALKAVGLPANDATFNLFGRILGKYQELGYEASFADIAHEAREQFVKDTFAWMDAHDDEALMKLLGDDRRKRLREYELKALNGGKSMPKPANDNADEDKPRRSAQVKELSEAAFRRRHGG